ncbi:MAG: archaeosortase/exosortase family protein [Candidatus Micrarchaeia archaeon]
MIFGKKIAVISLLVAFLIASANSIVITNPSILDNNPSTYIIVVIAMLPLLIVFSAKEELKPKNDLASIIFGILAFLAYLLLLSLSMVGLSFTFITLRVDALLMPLLLASFIMLIFGFEGLKKLKVLIVYSIFASPVLLMPVIQLNNAWTIINVGFVYGILKAFGLPLVLSGFTLSTIGGTMITISNACVSVGDFIALIMFLVPVAYLYNGSIKSKFLWLAWGFVLMLLLNLARIFAIVISWLYYGLQSSILAFHIFAGEVLFYASIVVMMLVAGRFGLAIPKIPNSSKRRNKELGYNPMRIAIAIAFAVIAFVALMPIRGFVITYAPLFGTSNATQIDAISQVLGSVQRAQLNITQVYTSNTVLVYGLNKNGYANEYALVTLYSKPEQGLITANFTSASNMHSLLLPNGIAIKSASLKSDNSTFLVDYFAIPYLVNGTYITENYNIFAIANNTKQIELCKNGAHGFTGIYTYIYNLLYYGTDNQSVMCSSYYIAGGA